jgi:methoxymalonate biosynthesis acyl carrier protein
MSTSGPSIEERIRKILNDRLQVESPAPDEDLFQEGILDSLSFVDMLVALEGEFSISIALDQIDLDEFRSITRICNYIKHHTVGEASVGRNSSV